MPNCMIVACTSGQLLRNITPASQILAESHSLFPESQCGFRKLLGTFISLIIVNRMKEDVGFYDDPHFRTVLAICLDLKKAFPSLDWKSVQLTGEKLNLLGPVWKFLLDGHRNAQYIFGDGPGENCRLKNGCKEGCVSSFPKS